MVKGMVTSALVFLFASCSLGMNETLGRAARDPYGEVPLVRSFAEEYVIQVRWTADEAADEYLLYRAADDGMNPRYGVVYAGPLTEAREVFLPQQAEERYLYRLGKRRGRRYFVDLTAPGKAGLGVVGDNREDIYEPNGTAGQAAHLSSTTLKANSYYYVSNSRDGVSIYDEDWYCVDIPAHWKAQVRLIDTQLEGGSVLKRFNMALRNESHTAVESGGYEEIRNTGGAAGRFYFRIFPNWSVFQSSGGGHGGFAPYWIQVISLQPDV